MLNTVLYQVNKGVASDFLIKKRTRSSIKIPYNLSVKSNGKSQWAHLGLKTENLVKLFSIRLDKLIFSQLKIAKLESHFAKPIESPSLIFTTRVEA